MLSAFIEIELLVFNLSLSSEIVKAESSFNYEQKIILKYNTAMKHYLWSFYKSSKPTQRTFNEQLGVWLVCSKPISCFLLGVKSYQEEGMWIKGTIFSGNLTVFIKELCTENKYTIVVSCK